MKNITKNIFNSLKESSSGNTIKDYAINYLGGFIDNDVTDTEIDMMVAFSFDFNDKPDADFKEYSRFMNLIAERTKIVKVNDSEYGATLVCDFSSVLKPYNEEWKDFFDMDNSEFSEDEAWAEAVDNLEPLISGNAGDSTYKDFCDILEGKNKDGSVVTNEADNMESVIDEAARYLFDEGDSDYLPDYEEFNDSIMEIPKDLFDKAKDRALEALGNLAEHSYYDHDGGYGTVLELNDNHTMWELNNEKKSDEEWASIVQSKLAQFKADTGVELMLLGRMGRHACVEPTYDNCMNFTFLQETQEKLEQEAIDEFNNEEMNESEIITNKAYGRSLKGNAVKSFRDNGRDEGLIGRVWIDANGKTYDLDLFKIDGIWSLKYGTVIPEDLKSFIDDYGYDNLARDAIECVLNYRKNKKINESIYTTDDGTPADIVADNITHADSDPRFQTKEQVNDEKLCADLADFALETTDEEYWNEYSDEDYYEKNKKDYMKQINDVSFIKGVVDLLETRLRNLGGVDEEYDTESLLAEFKEKLSSLEKPMKESATDNEDVKDGIRKRQLENNLYDIICLYGNGVSDGDYEPFKNNDELVDYVYSQVFDQKSDGNGSTRYGNGICKDLKYLGKDYIVSEIIRIGNEEGIVEKPINEEIENKELYIYSNAESEDKSDAISWAETYKNDAPNLKFKIHSEGPMYFVDFIGSKEDIAEYLKDLGWYTDEDIESMELIKPYNKMTEDVDYLSDIDEENTEDVSNAEPIGTYVVSNNSAILVYQIEYDIEDKVLVGDSSDTTKAHWTDIIYEPNENDEVDSYFYYGDIKVPFNEVMRTDI